MSTQHGFPTKSSREGTYLVCATAGGRREAASGALEAVSGGGMYSRNALEGRFCVHTWYVQRAGWGSGGGMYSWKALEGRFRVHTWYVQRPGRDWTGHGRNQNMPGYDQDGTRTCQDMTRTGPEHARDEFRSGMNAPRNAGLSRRAGWNAIRFPGQAIRFPGRSVRFPGRFCQIVSLNRMAHVLIVFKRLPF